jgi:hypothetical protein
VDAENRKIEKSKIDNRVEGLAEICKPKGKYENQFGLERVGSKHEPISALGCFGLFWVVFSSRLTRNVSL